MAPRDEAWATCFAARAAWLEAGTELVAAGVLTAGELTAGAAAADSIPVEAAIYDLDQGGSAVMVFEGEESTIIWFVVFLYKPMYGLQIAFKDFSIFRGVAASPWVGFEHFETLFSNSQFLRAIKNTVIISAYNLVFGFPAPIFLALMFNEVLNAVYKRTAQTIVYLPHFISTVIIAGTGLARSRTRSRISQREPMPQPMSCSVR